MHSIKIALVLGLALISNQAKTHAEPQTPVAEPFPFYIDESDAFDVQVQSYVAPDKIGGQSAGYYAQQNGGVVWLPDMSVAGKIRVAYQTGEDDYVVYSPQQNIDL